MKQLEQQVHAAAASIIDPETGKHAEVFVRRRSPIELTLRTRGSPAFVRELERRLHTRAQDSDEVIHARMAKAVDEMSHWAEYDYVVINSQIGRAFADVRAILAAERLKRERQTGLSAFVRGLQAKL